MSMVGGERVQRQRKKQDEDRLEIVCRHQLTLSEIVETGDVHSFK